MIFLTHVLWCALIVAPAIGAATNKREDTKGVGVQVAPVGRQLEPPSALKSAPPKQGTKRQDELLPAQQQQLLSEPEQREENLPKVEELSKGQRYEARPQVSRDELAEKPDEQQQRGDWESQQVELREEQRGSSEEQQPLDEQQQYGGEKGDLGPAAGLAEPYAFSYQAEGSSRSESGDSNGVVRGQYTIQGAEGPSRVVDYVADHNGFRAAIDTNEFGTEAKSAANVALRTSQPNAEYITRRLEGKTSDDLAAAIKGAPLVQRVESKTPAQQLPCDHTSCQEPPRAGKTLRLDEQQQESATLPAKSAQLRGPAKPLPAQPRNFESATAHRVYPVHLPAVATRPIAPAVVIRRDPPVLVRGPVPAVYRPQVQRDQFPPSPVVGYRRRQVAVRAPVLRPRVYTAEEEQTNFD